MPTRSQALSWLSRGAALLLAGLFGIAALGKAIHLPDFMIFLAKFEALPLGEGSAYVGIFTIAIELTTAGTLSWSRTRRAGSILAFLLLNVFFWIVVIESRTRGVPVDCPCFGWWSLGPSLHATLTLGGAALALMVFIRADLEEGNYRTTALTVFLYLLYVAGWAWPMVPNSEVQPRTAPSQHTLSETWAQLADESEPRSPKFFVFANLEDFSCSACQQSIEGILNVLARDSTLRKQSHLFLTSPHKSYSRRRAMGWLQALDGPLPKHHYLPYSTFQEMGIHKSCVIYYFSQEKNPLYRMVPFSPQRIADEFPRSFISREQQKPGT